MLREMQQLTLLPALALPSGKREMLWEEKPRGACIQVFAASLLLRETQRIPALPPAPGEAGMLEMGLCQGDGAGPRVFLLPQRRVPGPRR